MVLWIILGVITLIGGYLFALSKRLTTPHPSVLAHKAVFMSDDDLAKVVVPTPQDMADAMRLHGPATGKAYIVIGGSGLVGQYIVRTLLARGEALVRIIDVAEPKPSANSDIDNLSRAEFVKADVSDYQSIADAISRPFGSTKRTAQVIIHTVAAIRNFERLSYVKHLSHRVNVQGTNNIIKASQELGTVGALVYTSSAAVCVRPAKYLWLGLFGTRPGALVGDETPEDIPRLNNHYISTKLEGEQLVRAADGVKGIRTGILRPGMVIMGPESMFAALVLKNPDVNPTWGSGFTNGILNAWDLGRAHVQLADALFNRPDDVARQSFAITGQTTAHPFHEVRRMFQFYSRNGLRFRELPELPLYLLSHVLEVFLLARYLVLNTASKFTGAQVSPVPQWAMKSRVLFLQPAMWDLNLVDAIVDDTRARKVLGYRNYWSTEQTIKWTIEGAEGRRVS
ncbi:hypothetical protein RSOLAG22IIIB_08284 [Rhizoctonia solani]|uniref:3-beta hydroxysteroid dehydrogenase/isomerase domain-containing protein n=1 Tax=Rhizoctonia solani TaxID=456999 RepID=A0A0K6FSS2_9AGAM|nr:hypothetical protein RSOLAG22IIIB_08284 [Rhizoctonia solani]